MYRVAQQTLPLCQMIRPGRDTVSLWQICCILFFVFFDASLLCLSDVLIADACRQLYGLYGGWDIILSDREEMLVNGTPGGLAVQFPADGPRLRSIG
jgi:hypothetical protein